MNAMDAPTDTPPARIRVVVRNAILPDGVEISVRDACHGLFDKRNGTIFELCVTTKATGLGIGLSIVRSIVEAHGRSIEARNVPEGAAVFRDTLPVHLSC